MSSGEFWLRLLTFCALHRASVTSSYRTPDHNAAVGGVPHSPHVFGLAADVVYDHHVALAEAQDAAARLGLRLIREGDHDHLQPEAWRAG